MLQITDLIPDEIAAELQALSAVLDLTIPPKALDNNLLVATWNLRAFGDLTATWFAGPDDTPKRDMHALMCIAEIVSRFDVIALQEVKGNLRSLRYMLKMLGGHWGFSLTDVTQGRAGNDERMAYLFDTRKLQLSGLACELVVPEELLNKIKPDALRKQFARTPYAVSFRTAGHTFILITLHVLYGKDAAERIPELKAIAAWLADWASDINAWDHNLICLGDFNIDRFGDPLYQAFTSTGLITPEDLNRVPRTLFSDPNKPQMDKFYDQIAWFPSVKGKPAFSLKNAQCGSFDFAPYVLKGRNLDKVGLSWRISDHYPLWVEFKVR